MALILCGGMIACAAPPDPEPPSWDTFQAAARREFDGRTVYLVEWDVPVTLAQLRAYYDREFSHHGVATTSQSSTVDQIDGHDNIWTNDHQRRLVYCVSDDFGTDKPRAMQEIDQAARAWEAIANVNFRHVPLQDGNCANTNPVISFAVRPWSGGGACAFTPDGAGCVDRTLVIDFDDLDTSPFYPLHAPGVTTVGVFRHELGHILGLRHEHIQAATGCSEVDETWRAVTDYDASSVMHYPWCDGVTSSDLSITSLDRQGINALYPFDFSTAHDPGERYDLNADGRADICGRGAAGVYCALGNGTGFAPITLWKTNFSDASGWIAPEYYSTIQFPDLNGDHRADLCGRGGDGIHCALSVGTGFGGVSRWASDYSDANGWASSIAHYSTIQYPDVNNDGRADVCGRGADGIWCSLSTGGAFTTATRWSASFGDADGWSGGPEYFSTIRFPDVNGDGRADVCGRGGDGAWCALSSGAGFGAVALWSPEVGDPSGWNLGPEYYSTIRFPDVNGDGKADLCGRSADGLRCAISTGGAFGPFTLVVTGVSDAMGWNKTPAYYATLQFGDINGDHRADLCGRGATGMYCARSTGTGFTSFTRQFTGVSDAAGWSAGPHYYSTLRLADLDGDGKADVCGRGAAGIYCATSSGADFSTFTLRTTAFRDSDGWAGHPYYATIRLP